MPDIPCRVCGTMVPVTDADVADASGLSPGLDSALMEEHMDMHRRCTCVWVNGSITIIEPGCSIHQPEEVPT
jgi:hypothetical protein